MRAQSTRSYCPADTVSICFCHMHAALHRLQRKQGKLSSCSDELGLNRDGLLRDSMPAGTSQEV